MLAISAQIAIFVEQWSSESAGNEIRSRAFPFWMALPSQEYRFEVEVLPSGSTLPILIINQPPKNMKTTIPEGNTPEDIKTRKKIIGDFYAQWNAAHPDKKIWNNALQAYIHVKYLSINETKGHTSLSYESTRALFELTDILKNAIILKKSKAKTNDKNQKSFDQMIIMSYGAARLLVGHQSSIDEYVLYCIMGKK